MPSFEELIPLVERCFEQADANSDNDVTVEEFTNWVTHPPANAEIGADPLRDLWKMIAGDVTEEEKEEALHPSRQQAGKNGKKNGRHTGRRKKKVVTDPHAHDRAVGAKKKEDTRKGMLEKLATQFTLREMCGKTHFDLEEIKALRDKFLVAAGGNKALNLDQLNSCLTEVFPQAVNHDMLEKLASVLDEVREKEEGWGGRGEGGE